MHMVYIKLNKHELKNIKLPAYATLINVHPKSKTVSHDYRYTNADPKISLSVLIHI